MYCQIAPQTVSISKVRSYLISQILWNTECCLYKNSKALPRECSYFHSHVGLDQITTDPEMLRPRAMPLREGEGIWGQRQAGAHRDGGVTATSNWRADQLLWPWGHLHAIATGSLLATTPLSLCCSCAGCRRTPGHSREDGGLECGGAQGERRSCLPLQHQRLGIR